MKLKYKILEINREEIWSVAAIKNYLRISHEYDDALIASLTEAAIEYAENFIGKFIHKRALSCLVSKANKTICFNKFSEIDFTSVHQIGEDEPEDISDDFGEFEVETSSLILEDLYIGQTLEIKYNSGFGAGVPKALKLGLLKHISAMYELNESALDPVDEIRNLYLPYRKFKI